MADEAAKGAKAQTGNAQGRFVVSLPKEVGEQIDAIGEQIMAQVSETSGVTVELTRAQVVQALVKSALKQSAGDAGGA